MYQVPVLNIDKIRRSRRKVKNILSDIGLENCQELLEEFQKSDNSNNEAFEETDWNDFTDGFVRKHKKWPYRTRALCCSLCKYSTRNLVRFKSHVLHNHDYEQQKCALSSCSLCQFIGHPRALKKHISFFHGNSLSASPPNVVETPSPTQPKEQRYKCRKCGYPSSVVFAIKKHVLLKHLEQELTPFVGRRVSSETRRNFYYCKACNVNTGSLDHMLHHMLVEPSHHWVSAQVKSLIYENQNYLKRAASSSIMKFTGLVNIASQPPAPSNGSIVAISNHQQASQMLAEPKPGCYPALGSILQNVPNSTTFICAPGTNQTFLPPQASALVRLASAEAKGLLQPGATLTLQNATRPGPAMVQPSTTFSAPPKQAQLAIAAAPSQPSQNPQMQQVFLPSGVQVNIPGLTGSGSQPLLVTKSLSTSQAIPQGTMLTSQSLLSNLIPTGNKVNGLPTYTFAPLQMNMPVRMGTLPNSQNTASPLQPVKSASNSSPGSQQAKKWITCPLCNELFPSNVYEMHTEVAHKAQSKTSKFESVAARAPFLKKMPDKTVKCLMCKVLLSEKGLFEHLLHGFNCLYCSGVFYSIKQLIEHTKEHNPTHNAQCDFMRREYRLYTNGSGKLLFPYFDINTTAPKEVLGNTELNLALVTNSLDLIFLKMLPSSNSEVCQTSGRLGSMNCTFCNDKFLDRVKYLQHMNEKHFIAPTVHAILKSAAFKCIYCNGVYTGKVTQKAIMLHIQRCRCSPKTPQSKAPEKQPDKDVRGRVLNQKPMPIQKTNMTPGPYFYLPRTHAQARAVLITPDEISDPTHVPLKTQEQKSKLRLEMALKEAMEANKREREERAAKRKGEQEKLQLVPQPAVDLTVKLALDPSGLNCRPTEERKEFLSRYFNESPYLTKREADELAKRLQLNKLDVTSTFGNKQRKCMRGMQKHTAEVLLGFNMSELSKLKHNLVIPDVDADELVEEMDHHENAAQSEEPM